ncbi:hypothetical protein G6F37_004059 [Rhizopus arrhizus]|nr:hypothetical protein G6F38_004199 [Rhizopus arrhizus]KAG1160370.1 hypothetical protein G6F37_004059 [Rhizopus arrhizus]
MTYNRYLLIKLFITIYLFLSVVEAASKKSWKFKNWNNYKDATAGRGSDWDNKWGIPNENGWQWIWNGVDSVKHVVKKDPSGDSSDMTLRVKYPAHSRNPESRPVGGIGFKASPISINNNVKKVEFAYSVYFPEDFDFVKGKKEEMSIRIKRKDPKRQFIKLLGGKLPGLFGGHGSCTGGADDKTCFTTRLMWRTKGEGEIYAYLPYSNPPKALCGSSLNVCNPDYGMSLGRGTFRFAAGKWTHVRQVLTMNTPGKQDGRIVLYSNNKKVFTQKNVVFRTNSAGRVSGIMFHTFFGGSDNSWETPKDQYSYFKDFSLKAIY